MILKNENKQVQSLRDIQPDSCGWKGFPAFQNGKVHCMAEIVC